MTSPTITGTHLRTILAHAPTSLVALGSLVDDRPDGMVAASFVGISLDPPLVGVAIQDSSTTWPRLRQNENVGISILTEDHAHLVRQLSGPQYQRFQNVDWYSEDGSVFLDYSCATLSTRLVDEISIGDHTLAVLQVNTASESASTRPLVFHGSQITTVAARDN